MREITLDEMIAEVRAKEAMTAEPEVVTDMIESTAQKVFEAGTQSNHVRIMTDYDADGICSAYIMRSTLLAVNPDLDVKVICNDRRGSYGTPKDLSAEPDTLYMVLDMGSNELDYIRDTFGEDSIIIDHHLIGDPEFREAFQTDARLLNPHCITFEDGKSTDYCATGLCYRVFQTLEEKGYPLQHDAKLDKTLAIVAAIGTVSDMVDVLDVHSYNRDIIKAGIQHINTAYLNEIGDANINEVLGWMMMQCGIDDTPITAKKIGFNIGAFLNSSSRMSVITNSNGAQTMFDALAGKPTDYRSYLAIDRLVELNKERKELLKGMQGEDYTQFVQSERFQKDSNIAVYVMPDNTPATFCGLIANRLTDAIDKAVLVVTYSKSKQCYIGSGRNVENNQTGLKDFLDSVLEAEGVAMQFGGHRDAVGISRLDDIEGLKTAIEKHKDEMVRVPAEEQLILKLSPSEIGDIDVLKKVMALEPIGTGLKLPPIVVEGVPRHKEQTRLSGNPNWKKLFIAVPKTPTEDDPKPKDASVTLNDWSYSKDAYPVGGDKKVKFLASLELNDYKGLHVEASPIYNQTFLRARLQELQAEKPAKTGNRDRE